MALTLTLSEAKSIIKTVGSSRKVKISTSNIFVASKRMIGSGKSRHCFFVSTGGHGMGRWVAGMAANWISNVVQGAAGASATGLGAFGSGLTTAGGKGSGLAGLSSSFKDGVIRDARELEKAGGAGNLVHIMKAQNALVYFGAIDTWGTVSWGLWGGLPSDSGQWNYFVQYLLAGKAADTSYQFEGSYLRGKQALLIGSELMRLK